MFFWEHRAMSRPTHEPRVVSAAFFRVIGGCRGGKCATGPLRRLALYRVYARSPIKLDKTADFSKNVAFYAECDTDRPAVR